MADDDIGFDSIVFRGSGPDECEAFISKIRKRAFAEQRHRDNEWMAFLASSCFVGEALYWYEELDSSLQEDWSRLRPALLARFGRKGLLSGPSHSSADPAIFPTPPAAMSAPAAPPPPVNCTHTNGRRGYLKVVEVARGELCGYLSSSEDSDGRFVGLTQSTTNALKVLLPLPTPKGPFEISILARTPSDSLGATWHFLSGEEWLTGSNYWASCCSYSNVMAAWPKERKVWTLSDANELRVNYPKAKKALEPRVEAPDCCYLRSVGSPLDGYKRAKFIFEESN